MESYIIVVLQGHFNIVFHPKKAVKFCERFMKEIVVIMPTLNLLLLRLFVMDFIGRRLMLMLKTWSVSVMDVRNFLDGLMCRHKS